jgi:uroporphyrinogen decarboxylase
VKITETMTSRQRVLGAINHEPVDRMPIDLGGTIATGISAFAYHNLLRYLGLATDNIRINDMMKVFLAYVDEDIRRRFHCDCIALNPGWASTAKWNPRGKYSFIIPTNANPQLTNDRSWVVEHGERKMAMREGSYYFDGLLPDLHRIGEDALIEKTARHAEQLYKETDYYIILQDFPGYFSVEPKWLCDMLTDPEKIKAQNELLLESSISKVKKVISSMGGYVQSVHMANDMGIQTGPWCSLSAYEDVVLPYYKRFCSFVHENSDLKVHLHSCGSIKPLIPHLIDCGIDVLDPVQISAQNMNPTELKREFGDKICFWGGGCDTQNVLGTGTADEVSRNAAELIGTFKPNSGYVFSQVHNIMGNVPPENIVAMLDTAYEISSYA